jgi:hypothetical protein
MIIRGDIKATNILLVNYVTKLRDIWWVGMMAIELVVK